MHGRSPLAQTGELLSRPLVHQYVCLLLPLGTGPATHWVQWSLFTGNTSRPEGRRGQREQHKEVKTLCGAERRCRVGVSDSALIITQLFKPNMNVRNNGKAFKKAM